VDLIKLNDACLHDPFPTPFTDEVLDNVGGQEVYSFTDGFSGYHQIRIAPEDRHRILISFYFVSPLGYYWDMWFVSKDFWWTLPRLLFDC
jgi:hypothetical protein